MELTDDLPGYRGMVDVRRFSLARGNVTLSTVGVIPKIRQLTQVRSVSCPSQGRSELWS